ncbi:oxygen-insensitive NADPH nitroreductase [Salmonella enterica subsp. enterica]|nr:oxygen-insensitive NADPH nitroreductase [Salmonella enterica subsp. enterica]
MWRRPLSSGYFAPILIVICRSALTRSWGLPNNCCSVSSDTAMMGQNALTAAESLGLGGVYIGGIRNNIESVTELLKLPKHVLPLFGLCLGWPADNPDLKPRLPAELVVHENQYPTA